MFLRAWINEVMAKVTAADLAQDVDGAERLIIRHNEFKAEINSRQDSLNRFYDTGNDLIKQVLVLFSVIICALPLITHFNRTQSSFGSSEIYSLNTDLRNLKSSPSRVRK